MNERLSDSSEIESHERGDGIELSWSSVPSSLSESSESFFSMMITKSKTFVSSSMLVGS